MTYIVTPFINKQQGRELELSILSWTKFFTSPFTRIIIGDYAPCLADHPEVIFIPQDRVPKDPTGNEYRPHLDMAAKFLTICNTLPENTDFVRVSDDCYPVDFIDQHSFSPDSSGVPFAEKPFMRGCDTSPNRFDRNRFKTRCLLEELGLSTYDYTTHAPIIYNTTKLKALIDRFDLTHNSHVIESLYFNYYYPSHNPTFLTRMKNSPSLYVPRIQSKTEAESTLPVLLAGKLWLFNCVGTYSPHTLDFLLSRLASLPSPQSAVHG